MKNLWAVAAAVACLALAGCGRSDKTFHIVAGSEEQPFEPIVQEFCASKHVTCKIDYKGSLDIGLMLAGDAAPDADALWPASNVWLDIYDSHRRMKDTKSIGSSPVILGVRMAKARELGWIGKSVRMDDILQAVSSGRLSFLMTSATQSNSGASAYLAMLAASFGTPDRLDPRAVDDPAARAKVKALLKGVARSSGSSGWLKELYLSAAGTSHPFDAMWNYEFVLKEANDELRQKQQELLYAVYPADGVSYANAPLGYVERGQDAKSREFFLALQAHLLTPEVQAKIAADGRRTAPGMAQTAAAEKDWNFDPGRLVPSIALPEASVIARALTLYQEVLRKPSLTAICLDFSGSMQGEGENQVQHAMKILLTPAESAKALIQWTAVDRILILPFDSQVREVDSGDGTVASQAQLLSLVQKQSANDGTNMYTCATRAMAEMQPFLKSGEYLPAIVIMTDGKSDKTADFNAQWAHEGHAVPIFGVTFGDADKSQLDDLAQMTRARVFDGRADLAQAFRAVRGYN